MEKEQVLPLRRLGKNAPLFSQFHITRLYRPLFKQINHFAGVAILTNALNIEPMDSGKPTEEIQPMPAVQSTRSVPQVRMMTSENDVPMSHNILDSRIPDQTETPQRLMTLFLKIFCQIIGHFLPVMMSTNSPDMDPAPASGNASRPHVSNPIEAR
jgi:hypothetical protein